MNRIGTDVSVFKVFVSVLEERTLRTVFLAAALSAASVTSALGQSVEMSWLQQAGVVCGGGLTIEARGDFEAAFSKRLKLADVGSEGTFKQSDVEKLLGQFGEEAKEPIYRSYVECVLNLMAVANSTSSLPPPDITLQAPVTVAPLEAIKRGQRFVLAPNDVAAIKDYSQIFTVNAVGDDGRPYVYFTWSNSVSGQGVDHVYARQGTSIVMGEQCSVIPYKIDIENSQVSFLSSC
ncbi:MAG: hypothetical protein N4A53_12255 [Pelagimonas sp.]|nr:hypothetical protein [Pelagimonas sp.]